MVARRGRCSIVHLRNWFWGELGSSLLRCTLQKKSPLLERGSIKWHGPERWWKKKRLQERLEKPFGFITTGLGDVCVAFRCFSWAETSLAQIHPGSQYQNGLFTAPRQQTTANTSLIVTWGDFSFFFFRVRYHFFPSLSSQCDWQFYWPWTFCKEHISMQCVRTMTTLMKRMKEWHDIPLATCSIFPALKGLWVNPCSPYTALCSAASHFQLSCPTVLPCDWPTAAVGQCSLLCDRPPPDPTHGREGGGLVSCVDTECKYALYSI